MAQEITLPIKVQIENLQSVMKDMRSQLSTLKVDSSSYKKLSAAIIDAEKRIEQLQVQSARPFINVKQFSDVDKNLIKIEDDITKMRLEAGQIKFGDLALNTSQKNELAAFNQEIKNIEDSLKNVKNSLKESFLSSDIGQAWKVDHPEAVTQSFTQITNAITKEVRDQKTKLDEAKKNLEDYNALQTADSNLRRFMKNGHVLSEATMGEKLYNKIFSTGDKFKFKAGGKGLLESWLREQFQLSPDTIRSLIEGTGKEVKAAFEQVKGDVENTLKKEQIRINGTAKEEKTATNNGATLTEAVTQKNAAYQAALQVQDQLVRSTNLVGESEKELQGRLEKTRQALEEWKQAQTNAARGNETMSSSFQKASSAVTQLHGVVQQGQARLISLDQATNRLQGVSNFVNRYVGAYAIIRKVTQAIRNAFNNIKELDKVITGIAVVTNMSQEDLWNKVGQYTQMAQQYGVATKDVYTVSQIFYQQGLQTAQVMSLTTESLKMAKIAGIDYSTAANAMTVAIRAFRIEMTEAQQVTDTYSALAAKFAVSSSEIANAMEKTASSAANVGMSLQSTSAFISVMEQTTRESAQNIGSALKSIISRYGEMKASPNKLLNIDGEEVAFNKVDTALQSIGISIKDSNSQFRDFDDVIMELASKWNTLDNNTQRYIATVMAGNRQQSRFIALVSNYDELSRAMSIANNAENASIVQVAKTMDSLESKTNQLKNAFSQIYLDLHIESGLKNVYDWLTRILKTIGKLGVLKGAVPTLMNLVGFGTGVKSSIRSIQEKIQDQKFNITAETTQAQQSIDALIDKTKQELTMDIRANVDDTQLVEAQNKVIAMQSQSVAGIFSSMGSKLDESTVFSRLIQMQQSGALMDKEQRAALMTEAGLTNEQMAKLDPVLDALGRVGQAADVVTGKFNTLGNSSDEASQAEDGMAQSTDQATLTEIEKAEINEASTPVTLEQARAEQQAAQEAFNLARKEQEAAQGGDALIERQKDRALQEAANTLEEKNEQLATIEATQADKDEAEASRAAAAAANRGANNGDHTTLIKAMNVFSSSARILGTAITAFGAGHQDKSTDSIETSKLLTGVGNGLSGAGMGASIGRMLDPVWGPIVGAIGGFLVTGLGAIIDGAEMTIAEKIALQKEEAQKAADENLKKQAKVTDLSSQIDNLEALRKVMYNSTDDMEAYKSALVTMSEQYPELVHEYDSAGDAIIDIMDAEKALSQARLEGARSAREAAIKQLDVAKTQLEVFNKRAVDKENLGYIQEYIDLISSSSSNEEILAKIAERSEQGDIYSGFYTQLESRMSGVALNNDIDYTKDIPDYFRAVFLNNIEKWYKDNKEALGLTETLDQVTGRNETSGEWTLEQLTRALDYIDAQERKAGERVKSLNQVANTATGLETFLSFLNVDNSLKQSNLTQLENTKNYQGLFSQTLNTKLNTSKYTNLDEWKNDENSDFSEVTLDVYDSFIQWYKGLGETLQSEFATLDFSEYASADELIEKFQIDEENQDAFIKQFTLANQANRDRILKTIYATDENGNITYDFNEQLSGIAENFTDERGQNKAMDIAWKFRINEIIPKYADYFTNQLIAIDSLAEEGYKGLAGTQLQVLNTFANQLSGMTSKMQNEMFGIITNIDFSNYDTIQTAIENIENYAETNNIDIGENAIGPLKVLHDALNNAADSLIFNINTLAQTVVENVANATEKIDSIIATNKSGLSFDKAIEEFESLSATLGSNVSFDSLFNYDAILGKYVYSADGLRAAIEQQENNLYKNLEQLTETKDNYRSILTALPEFRDTGENSKTYDEAGLRGVLSHYNLPPDLSSYEDQLITQFLNSGLPATLGNFYNYIKDQVDSGEKEADKAEKILAHYEKDVKNQYFQNIDWSALALDTDYFGTNKILLEELAKELGLAADATQEEVFEKYLSSIENEEASKVIRSQTEDSIIADKIGKYQSAISELLTYDADGYLSQETQNLASRMGIHLDDIHDRADGAINAAEMFLSKLAAQIGKGQYTLEQYNQDAASILEKSITKQTLGKTLLDFASEDDIGAGQLEGLANSLNIQLTNLVDVSTGVLKDEILKEHLAFDKNTGTYKIKGSFANFVEALNNKYGKVIDTTSQEYIDALSAFNDDQINKAEKAHKAISDELNKVVSSNGGEQINLANTYSKLGGQITEELALTLKKFGAEFSQDGILTLAEGANIPAIAQELANLAEQNAALIPSELEALSDAIQDLLSSITDNITNGISGKLSNSGARDLQAWAKNNGIQNLDFTRTKNGLKLSQKSAKELYDTLKQIDTISAEIVLDALNESIEESVTNTKKLSGEIAELRATTESDDFKFMDHDIPSGQNNPLNYFENWTKAFKAMNEASKATGKDHNKIAYEDFYNIITEMGNLAETVGGDGIKIGNEIVSSSETAAALIEKGAAALSVAADGTLKVDLGKLGIDFAAGAADLKKDVGAGIKEVAKSQIAMLDSMIQLLETIVAMEELGKIDAEGNGIDLSEMFQMDGENFVLDENKLVQWTEGMHNAAEKILASADELGPDSDLYKGLENVKVNGTSLREIFEQARDNISVDADTARAYHAAISAFYAAMQSGDYDLDNIMSSIKEVLAGTDFEGNIDVGDMHLTFHKGIVLERDKDGNYVVDGQKYDENHLDAALQAQAVSDLTTVQNAVKKYDPETGEVTYTAGEFKYTASYDVDSGLYEVHFSDGDSATSSSKDGINLAISTWAKKNALTQEELGSEAPENTAFTYTSHTGVTVDAEVDVETGEIKFNTTGDIDLNQAAEVAKLEEAVRTASAETVAAAEAKLKESGEANSIEGTEITVKDPTVKLADGTELKLDLSGQKVTASGADIELENVEELSEKSPVEIDVDVDKSQEAYHKLRELQEETKTLDNMHPEVDVDLNDYITDKIHTIQETINSLQGKSVDVVTNYIQHGTPNAGAGNPLAGSYELPQATGNVGLAKAKGSTLMGELGPELVVSNGRYFVAGQNGAEFVDLAEDAIVFNHLQTEQLLKHGMSSTRGAAVTNERNAVAFAQGNINGGPAMASARAALAALKQLRAQWQAIANMGAGDLAGLGGSGGGGGGGGDKNKQMKAFVKQLEIWYNWLQRIAVLEQKINYEEAKRSEINSSFHPDGEEYVKSQKQSLDYLLEQAAVEQSLYESQQAYFDKRREELNKQNGPFDQLYTFDEYGQLKYKDGALEKLSAISSRQDKYGNAKTAEQQYNEILALNPDFANYMDVDSSGNKLDKTQDDWYVQAVQNFWDKIEADQQEMQNLHDSIEEHKENYLKLEEQKNEIMHEIEENQISLEKQVLAAIEESRQREIDELQKQRDAIQKASDNLIDGLSQQLQKERDMYAQKESGEELTKLQRQLAILQRSGGSASQIAALQKEISQKQQDTYFELQQAQIDALQEASDAEIEKLDAQIDLMTETLEYEKLHGMLWDQVYQVLQTSPEEIANFIKDNTSSYWGQSPTELAKTVREDLFSAEKFLAQGKYLGSISEIVTKYDEEATKKKAEEEKKKEKEKKKKKDNSNGSSSSNGGTTTTTTHSAPSSSTPNPSSGTESYVCNNDYTHAVYKNGVKVRDESHTGSTSCSKCGWVKKTTSPGYSIAAGFIQGISMIKPPKAAGGGYAKHGIYELGEKGTETVLTAEQTQVLRNNILSNRPNSLISLLKTYNESYGNISHISQELQNIKPESSESPVIIENASVNMNVTKMANDYDAQRAGEQALERMVQIARKTQGQNRIGR